MYPAMYPGQKHGARGDEGQGAAARQRLNRLRHRAEVAGGPGLIAHM